MSYPENRNIILSISPDDFSKLKPIMEQLDITFDIVSGISHDMFNLLPINAVLSEIHTPNVLENETWKNNKNANNPNSISDSKLNVKNTEKASEIDLSSDEKIAPMHVCSNMAKKITLNVGGKKFSVKRKILDLLGINHRHLHKITKGDKIVYFLDRDPSYFVKIIDILQQSEFDLNNLCEHAGKYSKDLINELCLYGLLDDKYHPHPSLILKGSDFPTKHNDIIKLVTYNDQHFETLSSTLAKSNYFYNKLKICKTNFFKLDIDPKIFKLVINFLRTGKLFSDDVALLEILDKFKIEYERTSNEMCESIVSHYISHQMEPIYNQMTKYIRKLDPRLFCIPSIDNTFQFVDGKYHCPENMFISPNVENINIIETNSCLLFDTEILFNLTNQSKLGDCVGDVLLCIDIPVLNPEEPFEYVDLFEYRIIEYVKILINGKPLVQTNGDMLYLYPIIYTNSPNEYHEMIRDGTKKIKLLYEESLIDIHRIILPLNFFNRQNHLPIKKIAENNTTATMVVKISPLQKIFKNEAKEIALLNIFLIINSITLMPSMVVSTSKIYNKQIIPGFGFPNANMESKNNSRYFVNIPINTELKYMPVLYIYNWTHFVDISVKTDMGSIYDVATISLEKIGLIKDFFFVIMQEEDFSKGVLNKFVDGLIELEILQCEKNKSDKIQNQCKNLLLHSKMDSSLLNAYIPLKLLGHRLPKGIYYYSFSADPKCDQMLGGLVGNDYLIRIKVKKMLRCFVKFFINEYRLEIF
jgi:hypothetical protein